MIRADMISTVGRVYLTSNIENDEYSYPKAYTAASLTFAPIQNSAGRKFEKLDIRFVKDNVSVLIETKQNFTAADEEQLSAYVEYEKALTGNKIVAILANTTNDNVKVWRGVISDGDLMPKETSLRSMDEYIDFYTSKINDKEKVMKNTYKLNEMLHRHSIPEKLRSQFVGTCLLALKNDLDYSTPSLTAAQIRTRIKEVLDFINTLNGYFSYLVSIGKLFDEKFAPSSKYIMDYFNFLRSHKDNIGKQIDVSNWKEFVYSEIFDVQKGFYNKKPEHNLVGEIPFLGATERCNGVTEYYSVDDIETASKTGDENNVSIEEKLFSGNALCVTNNGSVGCAFFQPTTFTCSHDVNPLYILDGCFNMYNALFVATVIEMDKYRWAYGRKWRPERMIKSTIRLPAKLKDDKYVPDWDYMENYMKSLPYGDRI